MHTVKNANSAIWYEKLKRVNYLLATKIYLQEAHRHVNVRNGSSPTFVCIYQHLPWIKIERCAYNLVSWQAIAKLSKLISRSHNKNCKMFHL
jgi:hypothetical protein